MEKLNKEKKQCSKQVYPKEQWGSFHGHQCRITKNIIMRNGKSYCRIHDPVREEAKRQERQKKWDKENKKSREDSLRFFAMSKACQGVSTEDLETIKVKDLLELIRGEDI